MYNSAFYKLAARTRLQGNYGAAVIGTLIYIIPTYLYSLISSLVEYSIIGVIIEIATLILVINIFNIGYFRFLLSIQPKQESDTDTVYDYNLILSGYTNNFKGTLKTTLIREIKLIGWALLPFVPLLVYAGVAAFVIGISEQGHEMYSYLLRLIASPTPTMFEGAFTLFVTSYRVLAILLVISIIGMFVLLIPYLFKTYEYYAVEMVLADKPEISTSDAFKLSREIMVGFRVRFFLLQLSFLLYEMLAVIIMQMSGTTLFYYAAQCLIIPYMNTTILEFYRERIHVIEDNTSVYQDN